jgi:hypothetical protein
VTSTTRYDATTTDIIPFNEFGDLDELDFSNTSAFDRESRVIRAPELDDLHDTDDLTPMRLAAPSQFRPRTGDGRRSTYAYRDSHTDVSDGMENTDVIDMSPRRGLHRQVDAGAVKTRLVAAAMAAGATAAAAYSVVNASDRAPVDHMVAAGANAFVDGRGRWTVRLKARLPGARRRWTLRASYAVEPSRSTCHVAMAPHEQA